MRLPATRPKAPESATGAFAISLFARSIASPQTIAHPDAERASRKSPWTWLPSPPREKRNELRVSSPSSLKRQAPAPLGGKIAPKPDKVVTACLTTRLHNFPGKESFLSVRHFFMVSPGEVASPFLSTAPAVPAPYVLASFGDAWNCRSPWVRHERTQACRASPCKKDMMRIVTDDAVACWRRVCKFVAGQYSLSAQRRANEPRSTPPSGLRSAAMPRPIRWLTKLRAARSSSRGIHY